MQREKAEAEYLIVRIKGNGSKRWDGRETEVPSRTVVRSGADSLVVAEVHWPGKGGKRKVWKCAVLKGEQEEEQEAVPCAKSAHSHRAVGRRGHQRRHRHQAPGTRPRPSSASSHTHAPERRPRPCHGPGKGKLQLEERVGEQEAELLDRRGKDLDQRKRELEKKRAGLGKGKGNGEINFTACF